MSLSIKSAAGAVILVLCLGLGVGAAGAATMHRDGAKLSAKANGFVAKKVVHHQLRLTSSVDRDGDNDAIAATASSNNGSFVAPAATPATPSWGLQMLLGQSGRNR